MSDKPDQTLMPVCPHCGHEFDVDDMNDNTDDLWAAAPNETTLEVHCPVASCDKDFWLRGSYRPQYATAIDEDDL